MNYPAVYACVLLLFAVTLTVRCQTICYHPGLNCGSQWGAAGGDGGGGGGWLLAMMESRARAQGGGKKTAELQELACDCCCSQSPCALSQSLCGQDIRYCSVGDCYSYILADAAADNMQGTPKYSAEVLTASLGVQKVRAQQERAKLQDMIEELIRMKNNNAAQSPTDVYQNSNGIETQDAASVPPSPY